MTTETQIRDDFMFARIGGRTYTLTETRLDTLQGTIEAIKQAADSRVATLTRTLNQDTWRAANTTVSDEHNRVIRESQATRVTIPDNMTNVPCVAINGVLCPVRAFILSPNKVDCTLNGLNTYLNGAGVRNINTMFGSEVFTPDRVRISTRWRIIIKYSKEPLAIPSFVAKYQDTIVRTHYSFHDLGVVTHGNNVQWHKMCIGNATATQYWGLPRATFNEQLNTINLDSLGGDRIYAVPFTGNTTTDRHNPSINITEWLAAGTIESVQLFPVAEEWRTV
jgi:hypothetical protein